MKVQAGNISIVFGDMNGQNHNKRDYARFADVQADLKELGSGEAGGHHGTDHPYTDYLLADGRAIRKMRPGHLESGYLELMDIPEPA